METFFYSTRFRNIKERLSNLLIFEMIMLIFSALCCFSKDGLVSGVGILFTLFNLFKVFYMYDIKSFAHYYEYSLATGRDLYAA